MNTVVDFLKRYENVKNFSIKLKKEVHKKENKSEFGTKSSCSINCTEEK